MQEFVTNPEQAAALDVICRLRSQGHQAYLAGGCVRDLLLGRTPVDFDVATSARPQEVLKLFPKAYAVGVQFGVVLVCPDEHSFGDSPEIGTEVATFRSDGAYSDGRHPDEVRFSDHPEEDVKRRDFTINGLLLDPFPASDVQSSELGSPRGASVSSESAVLDFVGGKADLRDGVIRAIGNPELRFAEDKLRLLRAIRFAARFAYAIEPDTMQAIRAQASQIGRVSRERVREELIKMLTEGKARRAFELLHESDLLEHVLPEIAAMRGVEQPPQFHPEGDVWVHTLLLLEKLEPGCSANLAFGALLHDVGKPRTFRRGEDRIRFDGHAEIGAHMAENICGRYRFSNSERQQIASLVENHMRFGEVKKMRESTLKRFMRLPGFEEHLELHRIDCLSSHGSLELYNFVREALDRIPPFEMRPNPLVTGHDLIAEGYLPGEQFRAMLALAEDAQLEGRITTKADGIAMVRKHFPLDRAD